MAGHNKWKQIKERKAKTDGAKSKIFGKFGRLITLEARKAGGNLSTPGLKSVIDRARSFNMPNDAIDRAVKKATEAGNTALESITYESYGPGGVAMIIEALTGSRNKASQEIKHILSKNGFELASIGSATWAFKKNGVIWEATSTIPISNEDMNSLEKLVEELEENEEVQEVFTNAE